MHPVKQFAKDVVGYMTKQYTCMFPSSLFTQSDRPHDEIFLLRVATAYSRQFVSLNHSSTICCVRGFIRPARRRLTDIYVYIYISYLYYTFYLYTDSVLFFTCTDCPGFGVRAAERSSIRARLRLYGCPNRARGATRGEQRCYLGTAKAGGQAHV